MSSSNRFAVSRTAVAGLLLASAATQAQTAGAVGARVVKGYWVEGGNFLAVKATTAWDNSVGCSSGAYVLIPFATPGFKQIHAAVVHAMASQLPLSGWASGCVSAWGQTYPSVYAMGVDF